MVYLVLSFQNLTNVSHTHKIKKHALVKHAHRIGPSTECNVPSFQVLRALFLFPAYRVCLNQSVVEKLARWCLSAVEGIHAFHAVRLKQARKGTSCMSLEMLRIYIDPR